jgi:CheY-like chemotaxis protein
MNPRRVLVIDDDDALCVVLFEVLTREGYEVVCAKDGLEALAALGRMDRPCVVLLDLVMPRMAGEDFLRELKRRGELGSLAVIRLSAEPAVSQSSPVLEKPIEVDRLLSTLRRAA